MITGAQLFVKALNEENVDTLFAYPGGQIIDLLDELYNDNSINMILPRHEQGLARRLCAFKWKAWCVFSYKWTRSHESCYGDSDCEL